MDPTLLLILCSLELVRLYVGRILKDSQVITVICYIINLMACTPVNKDFPHNSVILILHFLWF